MTSCKSSQPTLDVSVVSANFNNARFLDDFFLRFHESTALPREIIFVDDGSTDNSLDIVEKHIEKLNGLVVIRLKKNIGFANALNEGIKASTSKYIMRVDPDDCITPNRIRQQYDALETGAYDIIGSNAEIFHAETGKTLTLTNFPLEHESIERVIARGEHGVLHPTVMARAELFKKNSYSQSSVPAEDYDVFARFSLSGARFGNLAAPLTRYRVHANSASNRVPFSTIRKTFSIRDRLFGTKTGFIKVFCYYIYIRSYRGYLFAESPLSKVCFGLLACLFYPAKALARVKRLLEGRGAP